MVEAHRTESGQYRGKLMDRPVVRAAIVVSGVWGRTAAEREALETVRSAGLAACKTEEEVLVFPEGIRQRVRPDLATVYAQVDVLLAQLGLEPRLPRRKQ